MPRQVRTVYLGAIDHGMVHDNPQEAIVVDDRDRDRVGELLDDLVKHTGWEVFARVFLTKHSHLAFKAPEPHQAVLPK